MLSLAFVDAMYHISKQYCDEGNVIVSCFMVNIGDKVETPQKEMGSEEVVSNKKWLRYVIAQSSFQPIISHHSYKIYTRQE